MRILVVGVGSIGRRHCENLGLLNYRVDVCDPLWKEKRIKLWNIDNVYDDYSVFNSGVPYDLVLICTPTENHLETIHFFNDRKVPYIFCEKPLYEYPTGSQLMIEAKLPYTVRPIHSQIYINHAYKLDRGYLKLKSLIDGGMVGKIKHVTMENAYAFEKLHDYSWDSYSGIGSDDSHIFSMATFLFGYPKKILFSMARKEIVQCALEMESGAIVSIMTDCISKRYKKRIEVRGENGNLIHNWRAHEIFYAPANESERIAISFKHTCHLMEGLKYVMGVVESKGTFEKNNIFEATRDMELLEKIMGDKK